MGRLINGARGRNEGGTSRLGSRDLTSICEKEMLTWLQSRNKQREEGRVEIHSVTKGEKKDIVRNVLFHEDENREEMA